MFFKKKKKIQFENVEGQYYICSLFDRNLEKFYSLVLEKNLNLFFASLCRVYDRSSDDELLKTNLENLDIYSLGSFDDFNGCINSKIEYLGKLSDLILDYKNKQLKGGKNETKKDKDEV